MMGISDVYQVSEAREGAIAYSMWQSGNYILPYRYGLLVPSKPPLFHWLSSALIALDPSYGEIALRLPSAIAGVCLLLAIALYVRRFAGSAAGWLCVLILLTTYGFSRVATDGRVDMLFNLFYSLAVLAVLPELTLIGLRRRERKQQAAEPPDDRTIPVQTVADPSQSSVSKSAVTTAAVCCGLACMVKGPAGIALPVMTLVLCAFYCGGFKTLRSLLRWQWLIAVLVPLPWFTAAALRAGSSFFSRQLIFENVTRFVGGEGIASKPLTFYAVHVFTQLMPWTAIAVVIAAIALLPRKRSAAERPKLAWSPQTRLAMQLGLLWAVCTFAPLLAASGKRRAYLLVCVPGLAIALSIFVLACAPRVADAVDCRKWLGRLMKLHLVKLLLWLVLLGALWFCPEHFFSKASANITVQAARSFLLQLPYVWIAFFTAISVLPLVAYGFGAKLGSTRVLSSAAALALLSVYAVDISLLNGVKSDTHSYKLFAAQVAARGAEVHFLKPLNDESFDGFFYYYRGPLVVELLEAPIKPGVVYVTRRRWMGMLPVADSAFIEYSSGGRLIDEDDEQLVVFGVSANVPGA